MIKMPQSTVKHDVNTTEITWGQSFCYCGLVWIFLTGVLIINGPIQPQTEFYLSCPEVNGFTHHQEHYPILTPKVVEIDRRNQMQCCLRLESPSSTKESVEQCFPPVTRYQVVTRNWIPSLFMGLSLCTGLYFAFALTDYLDRMTSIFRIIGNELASGLLIMGVWGAISGIFMCLSSVIQELVQKL